MNIVYQDNIIIQTQPGHYHFQSSYEIAINDCLVRGIIFRDGHPLIHLDISDTEAHETVSKFVTEIAAAVGLVKDIKISNLALAAPQHLKLKHILKKQYADVVIEWKSFVIDEQNIQLDLSLTEIKFKGYVPEAPQSPQGRGGVGVLDLIKKCAVKPVEPELVPKLYIMESDIRITFELN